MTERALDGWRLRIGRGRSRRANSVWPFASGVRPLEDKIVACERAYAEAGRPPVFRIPSITPERGLDAALAARGYAKEGKTSVRLADLGGFAEPPSDRVTLEPGLSSAWMDSFARFDGMSASERDEHREIVALTRHPTMFASVRDGAAVVAVAAAVLQERFVYFNSVATDPARRRGGLARAVMVTLLDWAKRGGAGYAYLPVAKTNSPALALYNGLGFRTELYRYHYRTRTS